jgi:hypothetical protein
MKTILFSIAILLCAPIAVKAQSATQPDRVVRVTIGYHQIAGWEKPLIDGNPNLGHYHWTPQGGYDQGYLHIRSPQRPQGSVYTRPIHVSPDAYVPRASEFPPLPNRIEPSSSPRRETLIAGRLLPDRKVQGMTARPTKVATYADYGTYGTLLSKTKHSPDAFSSNESVSGQLLGRGKRSI